MPDAEQACHSAHVRFDSQSIHKEIAGENGIGKRRWIKAGPLFECRYEATFDVEREIPAWESLAQTAWMQIPADVIKYLKPSRYCHSDQFLEFVSNQFPDQSGGGLVLAMNNWINQNFTYDNSHSDVGTTATDSFVSLRGVCRDYAHVLIAFARAAGIPARFVSVYAPHVEPQDFHAVVEVYLDGYWHLIDPTGMANAAQMIRICVGRDAADASFLTSYGWMELKKQTVLVTELVE
ncbi:transglutaminase-like domain-containing protein [Lentibacter algarum]|uniref:transglutaminase-like domain-containing protein n=1 Tax=Lentibacter algarum TaxID=576131 RepID=UPI0020905BB7|nr:transglutaminase family protein [Lentibacter algarum]